MHTFCSVHSYQRGGGWPDLGLIASTAHQSQQHSAYKLSPGKDETPF